MGRDNACLKKAFGSDELGFATIPVHYSNVKIARIEHGEEMGCSYCFPHGMETINSKYHKNRRSWKYRRKTQYHTTITATKNPRRQNKRLSKLVAFDFKDCRRMEVASQHDPTNLVYLAGFVFVV